MSCPASPVASDDEGDGDGVIMSKEALMEALKLFDKDGDGTLSRDELRHALGPGLSEAELTEELSDPSTPLLLDVYATWCGPCMRMGPTPDN